MTFTNIYKTKLVGDFFTRSKVLLAIAGILLLSLLVACAPPKVGEDDTYTVGGTITGHASEVSLTLTYGDDDKTETLTVAKDIEKFTFAAKLVANQSFAIAVADPDGQTCLSSLTEGTIVDANITDITVNCSAAALTHSVSGTVSEAADNSQITVTLSHGDAGNPPANTVSENTTPDTTDGTFSFDVPENRVFLLSVASATANEVCTPDVTTFSAPITDNVTDADITCRIAAANTFSVGGAVSGLVDGETITLTLTPTGGAADNKVISTAADAASFTFDNTRLANGDTYEVTITSQPTGKTCTVGNAGTQTMGGADVTDIAVTCVVNSYSISGAVSGLANGETITLTLSPTGGVSETEGVTGDNDATAIDTFAFDTAIAYGTTYEVTTTSPTGKTCTVAPAGAQTMGDADVNITVTCVLNTYALSGAVSGLANGETVTLTLSPTGGVLETEGVTGDNDATAIDIFAFDTRLVNGDTYEVTTTSPTGKTCTVAPAGTQTMGDADVNITVTCILNTYSISGSVTGASSTRNIHIVLTVYDDNTGTGGTSQSLQASFDNATFSFTGIPENKYYILRSSSIATGETCSSDITTLTQITDNVTDALITCSRSTNDLFIKIWLANTSFEASQTTLNVFFSDTAVPATTGTPDKVINGSDPAVLIIPSVTISNSVGDGFYHDIGINNGQYYAITITTASGTCTTPTNATGGPVTASLVVIVTCD